jgi:hypothetical protein
LNTVRRTLSEEKMKIRKEKLKHEEKEAKKGFLGKKIELDHYINLPEGIQNLMLFSFFIAIPYFFGLMFIFFVLAQASITSYNSLEMDSFPLTWTIGYECLALLLLLIIMKSAFTFKQCKV